MQLDDLYRRYLEFPLVTTDTRNIRKNGIFFALKGENFDGNAFASEALGKGAAFAVVDDATQATSDRHILVEDVLSTLQRLATHHRQQSKARIVALTGSNGKTTTKELIHAVLSTTYKTIATKGNLNNHIGVPLTLLSIQKDTELAVVEMGANHVGEIAQLSDIAQPDFGYITNFGKAHLEGFGGVEGVILGKSELYEYLIANGKSVFFNADDPIQRQKLAAYIRKYGFSTTDSQYYIIEFLEAKPFVKVRVEEVVMETQLIGGYNYTNCAAAILMGKYFNVALPNMKAALEAYYPENNRSQIIRKNDRTIVLDAYNANPTSMRAALETFAQMTGGPKIVFLGDMFELGDESVEEHRHIAELTEVQGFDDVFLVGSHFYGTETRLKKFKSFDDLKSFLGTDSIPRPATLLIKGSRGMALERLLNVL